MKKIILLVGNPNVGKSVIFNRLTGKYAVVSNYPGTTVDLSRGPLLLGGVKYNVIDSPGTNSLLPVSEDEKVTRDVIFREIPDIIVQVADEKNLARALYLSFELFDLGVPMVLVLNMSDEAMERGVYTDLGRLSKILGIDIIKSVGTDGFGIEEIKKAILSARMPLMSAKYSSEAEGYLRKLEELIPKDFPYKRSLSVMLLAQERSVLDYIEQKNRLKADEITNEAAKVFARPFSSIVFNEKDYFSQNVIAQAQVIKKKKRRSWLENLGLLSMRPFPGYLIALLALFAMYEFVGVFGAGTLVDLLQNKVFGAHVNPFFEKLAREYISWPLLADFFVGKYGLFTMALTYSFAIVLPIVGAFFVYFGLLEDSGYLPRLSVMLDRLFRRFGLNGKAVLPMVLGLGCGTMAALSARILESRRERFIVIVLLSLTIPCSAQLGVILGLLSGLSVISVSAWFISITVSLFGVGVLLDKLMPGAVSPFVVEIPPLRLPDIRNIFTKVKMRLAWYLKEAVPLFVLGTAILFVADKAHLLIRAQNFLKPVFSGLMGLPADTAEVFVLGFLRRDYGAAGLFVMAKQGLLSPRQIVVSSVALTLFVPCIAQCFMVFKEQGFKIALFILVSVSIYAFLYSSLLNRILVLLKMY